MKLFVALWLLVELQLGQGRDETRREKIVSQNEDEGPQWGPKPHYSQERSAVLSSTGQVEHQHSWGVDHATMVRRARQHRLEVQKEKDGREAEVEKDLRKDGYPVTAQLLKRYEHPSQHKDDQESAMTELLLRSEHAQNEASVPGELIEKSADESAQLGLVVHAIEFFLEHHPILAIVLGISLGIALGLVCLAIYHVLQHKRFKSLRFASQGATAAANGSVEKPVSLFKAEPQRPTVPASAEASN